MFSFSDTNEILYNGNPCADVTKVLDVPLDLIKLVMKSTKEKPATQEYEDDIPELCANLMPHQKRAIFFALHHEKCLLCMCLGSGKTLVGLSLILVLQSTNLVVLPAALIENWKSEIQKFAQVLRVNVIKKKNVFINEKGYINLISYDALRKNYNQFKTFPSLVIADEAHMAKNCSSKRSIALAHMAKNCERLILLTASPVEKHASVWHILHMLDETLFTNFFKPNYPKKKIMFCIKIHNSRGN